MTTVHATPEQIIALVNAHEPTDAALVKRVAVLEDLRRSGVTVKQARADMIAAGFEPVSASLLSYANGVAELLERREITVKGAAKLNRDAIPELYRAFKRNGKAAMIAAMRPILAEPISDSEVLAKMVDMIPTVARPEKSGGKAPTGDETAPDQTTGRDETTADKSAAEVHAGDIDRRIKLISRDLTVLAADIRNGGVTLNVEHLAKLSAAWTALSAEVKSSRKTTGRPAKAPAPVDA